MKNSPRGFVVPLLIIIIAVLAIGGGLYVYLKPSPGGDQMNNSSDASISQVRKKMVGTWQSTDDPDIKIAFLADGTTEDVVNDQIESSGKWKVLAKLNEPMHENLGNGMYLKIVYSAEPDFLYYNILKVDDNVLDLSYIDRGNTLSYKRVK